MRCHKESTDATKREGRTHDASDDDFMDQLGFSLRCPREFLASVNKMKQRVAQGEVSGVEYQRFQNYLPAARERMMQRMRARTEENIEQWIRNP